MATYSAVKEIAELLDYSFTFQDSPGAHRKIMFPETKLMSLLIIAVKLSQTIDRPGCRPRTGAEPAALVIDWNVWQQELRQTNLNRQSRSLVDKINVTEDHALNMNGQQLDQYLDWYERTWAETTQTACKKSWFTQLFQQLIKCSA